MKVVAVSSCALKTITALVGLLLTVPVSAQPVAAPAPSEIAPASARSEVLIGFYGAPDPRIRDLLIELIGAELAAAGLSLRVQHPGRDVKGWAKRASARPAVLAAILLDVAEASRWRLLVVDTERGHALTRELPGGVRENAANVEAVVNIVSSAARALRDGLEVASAPIDAVVDPEAAAGAPRSTPQTASAPPARKAPPSPAASSADDDERGARPFGVLSFGVASFGSVAAATPGVALALGVRLNRAIAVQASGARYFPARVDSAYGGFTLDRSWLSLTAGPLIGAGRFVLSPQAGVTAEWIARRETAAALGVAARSDGSVGRVGALLALRGGARILAPLGLELTAGLAYFGRGVEFAALAPGAPSVAELGREVLFVQLGVDVGGD